MSEATLQRARQFLDMDQYARARDEALRCISQDPTDARAFILLSLANCCLLAYPEAREAGLEALRLDPGNPDAYHAVIGPVLIDGEFVPSARQWGVRWHLSSLRVKAAIAERYALDGLRIDPNHLGLICWLGKVHLVRGEFADAMAVTANGLALDPQQISCLEIRMRVHYARRDYEAAAADAYAILAIDPEIADAHSMLAELGVVYDDTMPVQDHADSMVRHDAEDDGLRRQHDILSGSLLAYAGLPGRVVLAFNRACTGWLRVALLLVGVALLIALRLGCTAMGYPLWLGAVVAGGVAVGVFAVAFGGVVDLALLSLLRAGQPPRRQPTRLIWAAHVSFVLLLFVTLSVVLGVWWSPRWAWLVVFFPLCFHASRSIILTGPQEPRPIPLNWDLWGGLIVGTLSSCVCVGSLLMGWNSVALWACFAVMVYEMGMLVVRNPLHKVEELDGRLVPVKEWEAKQKEKATTIRARRHAKAASADPGHRAEHLADATHVGPKLDVGDLPSRRLAGWSLALGIAGLWCCPFYGVPGLVFGVAAVVLAGLAMQKTPPPHGLAIAGAVLGMFATLGGVVIGGIYVFMSIGHIMAQGASVL